jgi:transposase
MSKTTNKFSPEVRERAVRMVSEHRADHRSEWDALVSIAGKIGCTAVTLRRWCRDEAGRRAGPAALADDDRARLKLLEREVKELRHRKICRRLPEDLVGPAGRSGQALRSRQA